MNIFTRSVKIGKESIEFIPLGEISGIKEGLSTADNKSYIYKEKNALGGYRIIDQKVLLKENELEQIRKNEKLRIKIIEDGIPQDMFEGRHVIPYDKGGSSDIDAGRLSNYYSMPQFFIDWSTKMVQRMKTLTREERKREDGKGNIKESDKNTIAAVFRNTDYFFKPGLTVPMAGIYSPTFRYNSSTVFDQGGNCIFVHSAFKNEFSSEFLLGVLCSKFTRYFLKNYINNSVNTPPDSFKPLPIPVTKNKIKNLIEKNVNDIIQKQKKDIDYSYQNNEQIEIDQEVYDLFKLNDEQIIDIENWFKRRYPKLINQKL